MTWILSGRGVALSMATLTLLSCSASSHEWVEITPEPSVSAPTMRIVGTVSYVDMEGGMFIIRDAGGVQYNPINLPDSFKTDKMAVEADVRQRDDLVSTAMVGPMIELLRIRAR
jgi:hypothetical protein